MEITKTKFNGFDVSVIFNGKYYFFHNSYYGWICIAERTEESFKDANGDQEFILKVGSHHTLGSRLPDSVVESNAKSFISKSEKKYADWKKCSFKTENADLANCYVSFGYSL